MRAIVLSCLVLACLASAARAEDDVGVVVTGDPVMVPEVASHLERWLDDHAHKVVASPLPPDAINTIQNCFLMDDQKCARSVVEARSKSESLVFAKIDVAGKDVTFNVYWLVKGHAPIGEHRVCEKCTEDAWHGIADSMMGTLATSSQVDLGRLVLRSTPPGLIVMIDSAQVGVTPLERDLPAGIHKIQLTHGGRTVGSREVEIRTGKVNHVTIRASEISTGGGGAAHGSRLGPALLLAGGIAAAGGGAILLYYGALGGPDQKYVYPDSTPIGLGLVAVGVGATIGGAILLNQAGKPASGPVISLGPGGAYLGWARGF